jgi:hypothetical protein
MTVLHQGVLWDDVMAIRQALRIFSVTLLSGLIGAQALAEVVNVEPSWLAHLANAL